MKIRIVFILILLSAAAFAQEKQHKWQRFSGKWVVADSKASEMNGHALTWKFYELAEYNSIVSLSPFSNYSTIDLTAKFKERVKTPAEFMISFAVTSESKSWFYHIYAFKITGESERMSRVSFIHSDRLDKSKPFNTKNNTFVKKLASADCKVKYDKNYRYRIAFEGPDVALYINGKKILSAPFPEKSHDGRIAISARNVKISVDKVEVRKDKKKIFLDDFNEDSIYVRTVKVRRQKQSETEDKKPE